jgi:hypothetical protein
MDATFRHAHRAAYHDDMLVVRTRRAAPPARAMSAAFSAGAAPPSAGDGLAALAYYERAGAIARVTPLTRRRAAEPAPATRGAAAALFSHAGRGRAAKAEKPHDRGSIVELKTGEDLHALRRALKADPAIESVERVPVRHLLAAPAKTGGAYRAIPQAKLWNLRNIRWAEARALPGFREATQVDVAVLDTGVDAGHPDLKGRVATYVHRHADLKKTVSARDIVGHGTHVCGVIGALIDNGIGIDGVGGCRLHVWKIFTDTPTFDSGVGGFTYDVDPVLYRRALADCAEAKIDVMNLSIGGGAPPDAQEKLLYAELMDRDVAIVAAMGNYRRSHSPTLYPAATPGVIAVGSTGPTDRVSAFSSAGRHIALCAPGEAIWSTMPTYPGQEGFYPKPGPGKPQIGKPYPRARDYVDMDGTSMAAPHVAAAAALLRAKKGKLTPAAVRKALRASAERPKAMGKARSNVDYGAGRLDLEKLLR